jgi:predicted ATPase
MMGTKLKSFRLEPVQMDECLAHLLGEPVDHLIVPRELPELDRLVDHICHLQGSYLVTGYRGVGKTSFVNYALARVHQRLSSQSPSSVLVPVFLSLARSYEVEKLLRRVIRQLYRALIETRVDLLNIASEPGEKKEQLSLYTLLPTELQGELNAAYLKTSAKVSEATTEALKTVIAETTTHEFSIGAEGGREATVHPDPLPVKLGLKLTGGYTRSKTSSKSEETARETADSLEYLEYDDEIAQAELARSIANLTGTPLELLYPVLVSVPRRLTWFWQILGKIRHRDYLHKSVDQKMVRKLHLVFVFDELDKVAPAEAQRMLQSLKELLITSKATFIFVGGWEFASQWLARTQPEDDLLYSLFVDIIYVPLYTDEEVDDLIQHVLSNSDPNQLDPKLLAHLKLHCSGTPRELFRQILPFVYWDQGRPTLHLPAEKRVYSKALSHVRDVNHQIPLTLPLQIKDDLKRRVDEWLMIAEREGEFFSQTLYNPDVEKVENLGGQWQQATVEHLNRFLEEMLKADVFLAVEGTTPERYRFNTEFSLGTWIHLTGIPYRPSELVQPKELQEEQDVVASPQVPFQAPPQISTFVDREAELKAIRQALDAGSPVVQIAGMGGIGKTALAARIAHQMRSRFPDGVLWIAVGPHTTPDSALHHIALSYDMDLDDAEIQTLSAQVRSLLATKKTLLVLDGIEGWSDTDIELLLPGTENCQVIITTRRHFRTLERLGSVTSLDALSRSVSLTLLRKVAGYQRSLEREQVADELCALLGDHPLAIDIAGRVAKSEDLDLKGLLQRLRETGERLAVLELPSAQTPDASISLAFRVSYDRLTETQQEVFRAAAVFEGEFAIEGITYLLNKKDLVVEEMLENLVEVSLVSRAARQQYRVHPLLRDYALTLAMQHEGELDMLRRRHARYFLKWIKSVKGRVE